MEPAEFDQDLLGTNRRTWEVCLNEETYEIEPWQIASASTANEQRNARPENKREVNNRGNMRPVFSWTETRYENELISLHVATQGIADLAGFHLSPDCPAPTEAEVQEERDDRKQGSDESELHGESASNIIVDVTTDTTEDTSSIALQSHVSPPMGNKFDWSNLTSYQNRSWKSRGKDIGSHYKRIALVQWQVEEFGSYRHPIYECDEDSLRSASKGEIGSHEETIEAISYVEHRRRRLLTEVLRACKAFDVDLLLLPEYSTRPETVDWLLGRLRSQNINLTVWAGTFRFPPFHPVLSKSWPYQPPDWSSVLPIISRETNVSGSAQTSIKIRQKKYPSIAYGEEFNPPSTTLQAESDISTHVTELICSEIFLASSPTNLIGLWKTWNDLSRQFGNPPRSKENGIDYVLRDMKHFADETTMCNATGRRSILFVPAMTPRTVDYAVLGQANYLAAGLTTVFCNDSGRHSHGQSCFIGHDGYDKEGNESAGLPGPTPYHGITPGLYRPFQGGRGWLDQNEQAVVIADVDPIYQAGGKPRPQNLMPPLKLIAHLPILEIGKFDVGKTRDYGNMVDLKSPEFRELMKLEWPDTEFWRKQSVANISCRKYVLSTLLTLLSDHIMESVVESNTIRDTSHSRLAALLRALAFAAPENSRWLKQRADAYAQEHAANPMPYPPPVALDWLYVDLNKGNPRGTKIQVPPLKCPPPSV